MYFPGILGLKVGSRVDRFFCFGVEGLIFNKIKGNNRALPIVARRNISARHRVMDNFPATVFGGVA
jgi:hypothetical protein